MAVAEIFHTGIAVSRLELLKGVRPRIGRVARPLESDPSEHVRDARAADALAYAFCENRRHEVAQQTSLHRADEMLQ